MPRTQDREFESQQPETRRESESPQYVNDLDLKALDETVEALTADPSKAQAEFSAKTTWNGGLKSRSHIDHWQLGGEEISQDYDIDIDEPTELLGGGSAPNPQMFLQAAINSCMLNTFVAAASVMGVELEDVEFESRGELDLRGFLGIDESIDAGYHDIDLQIRVKGDGTPEQYEKMWELVQKQSPNYFNTTQPVRITADIEIQD